MKCIEARRIVLGIKEKVTAEMRRRAWAHIADCRVCRRCFDQLAAEIYAQDIRCDRCLEMMPAYVGSELAGVDVQREYPAVWQHLQHCTAMCSQVYDEVYQLLLAQREQRLVKPLSIPSVNLPFLSHQPSGAAWVIERLRDMSGRWSATIVVSRAYLTSRFTQPSLAIATRASRELSRVPEKIPLVDDLLDEENRWLISVEAIRDRSIHESANWQLQVSLISSTPLPPMEVAFSCGEEEQVQKLSEKGKALFTDIPPHWLPGRVSERRLGNLVIRIQESDEMSP